MIREVKLSKSCKGRGQCGDSQGRSHIDHYFFVILTFNSLNSTSHLEVGPTIGRPLTRARDTMGGTGQTVIGCESIWVITQHRGKKDRKMDFIFEYIFLSTKIAGRSGPKM